ncbi:MAG: helix-turn-helix transcriptional regulator [Acidimicrobiales bacterium]|nr:helix-turn-helix transcriptional regulator [Acidimicrobiales bacterium]
MFTIRTPRDLGAAVRQARRDLDLSQADLAAAAGVSRQWLSALERGKRTAELGLVLRVLDAAGLTLVADGTTSSSPTPQTRVRVDLDSLDSLDAASFGSPDDKG